MAWQYDLHSQLVAWMKIILPLASLGLLSTLFLISTNVDPTKTVPITQIDLEQRAQDLGATKPAFAGMTTGGDQIMVQAQRARPDREDTNRILANEVTAQLLLTSGSVIDISSDHADVHQSKLTATLDGNVDVITTTGYKIDTDRLFTRLDQLHAETPGPVEATGPPGDLTAGRMLLTSDEQTGMAHLLFTDGVKLIYTPRGSDE